MQLAKRGKDYNLKFKLTAVMHAEKTSSSKNFRKILILVILFKGGFYLSASIIQESMLSQLTGLNEPWKFNVC